MPTNTWQAYNFRDADGNGWGDTWYAKGAQSTAALGRMFIRRGVPPQWRKYDVGFLRWLHMDVEDSGDPHRDRPRVDPDRGGADQPLRLRHLPGPHRVRDPARARPDPQLPRPRRQPRLPLREQLLLGGAARGPCAAANAAVARPRPARSRRSSASSTARTTTAGSRSRSSSARPRPRPGSTTAPASPTARSSARSSAATGSRSTQTTPFTPPGTIVLAEIPDLYGPGPHGADDLLRDRAGRARCSPAARSTSAARPLSGPCGGCSRTSGRGLAAP